MSYPDGKLAPDDEGETTLTVTCYRGKVVIELPGPTRWVGFTPAMARELAAALLKHAEAAEREGWLRA